ncbi:antibiotic biosynthesis monooxygenase [Nostoc sp. FACHB-110]|uniref:antibiotic biosynthesis monooxygenase n=1 Tax=Nostoc sp. FACHB-110 TaxID=2692834 RepID=UPI001681D246|nr:antibiotic biosynthesis monooxygenase [Nostoc sp. FACHB-110]MBD2438116.1 antibiotic biosynthesis monooxygenase [Nostoc sp. FACHB-110]
MQIEHQNQSVTVVISQIVKRGYEADYEAWLKKITSVARTYLGHLGTNVIRPQSGMPSEYVIIFRFDSYENLKVWMTSREREVLISQAQNLVQSEPKVQELCGLEAWFSLPGKPLKTPPRYKTALITWVVVYILSNVLNIFLAPFLKNLPPLIISLVISVVMVLLLTYVVMPRVTRLFSFWLYGKS